MIRARIAAINKEGTGIPSLENEKGTIVNDFSVSTPTLAVTGAKHDTVTLSWNAPDNSNILSYDIEWADGISSQFDIYRA